MTVKYFATIRTYAGEATRRLDEAPATLRELLDVLTQRYGMAFHNAVLEDGDLSPQVIILVNGRNVLYLQKLSTPLEPQDEVSIFPMVAGG
ncbi:MAG TPA: ubiquitin-like small modifier protein 1 [Thermoleophilia bacterium]|nr:ubiquitin-like small modifier protein 1 [Thermoleophilia bacterium]